MIQKGKVVVKLDDEDNKLLQEYNLAIARKNSAEKRLAETTKNALAAKKRFWIHVTKKYNLDPEEPLAIDRESGSIREELNPIVQLAKALGLTESAGKEEE